MKIIWEGDQYSVAARLCEGGKVYFTLNGQHAEEYPRWNRVKWYWANDLGWFGYRQPRWWQNSIADAAHKACAWAMRKDREWMDAQRELADTQRALEAYVEVKQIVEAL